MMQQQAMNRELPVPYAPDETGYYMPREESRGESRGRSGYTASPFRAGRPRRSRASPWSPPGAPCRG